MLRWTLRNMIAEPLSLLASAGAIAGAFALVLFFEAIFAGESKQIVAYIDHTDADVWVMQRGVGNMHMATSFVSDWKADDIAAVPGVSRVTPILYLNTVVHAGKRNWFSFVVGLDAGNARAGPWDIVRGKRIPEPGEAVVPAVMAKLTGLKIGDPVIIGGHRFTVSGLSRGTFSMANSVTFVTMSDLSDVMSTSGSASYFLVDGKPGIDGEHLAARIRERVRKVNAISTERFVANDWAVAMQMGLEIISLMAVIGSALAILLTGFAVYSHTVRREGELAVMKALGVGNRAIYASVMAQAIWLVALGFLLAVLLVSLATPLTRTFVPQVTLFITIGALGRVGLAALIVALLAAALPARRVVRLDPLIAFKS